MKKTKNKNKRKNKGAVPVGLIILLVAVIAVAVVFFAFKGFGFGGGNGDGGFDIYIPLTKIKKRRYYCNGQNRRNGCRVRLFGVNPQKFNRRNDHRSTACAQHSVYNAAYKPNGIEHKFFQANHQSFNFIVCFSQNIIRF